MHDIAPRQRRVINIYEAEFEPWVEANQEDSGQSVLQLDRSQPLGVGFHIFRMAPGTTTTPHEHTSAEEFLLLSGDLTDNDGTVYRVGDLVWMDKGTQHCSSTRDGCVLAVYIPTAEKNLV